MVSGLMYLCRRITFCGRRGTLVYKRMSHIQTLCARDVISWIAAFLLAFIWISTLRFSTCEGDIENQMSKCCYLQIMKSNNIELIATAQTGSVYSF